MCSCERRRSSGDHHPFSPPQLHYFSILIIILQYCICLLWHKWDQRRVKWLRNYRRCYLGNLRRRIEYSHFDKLLVYFIVSFYEWTLYWCRKETSPYVVAFFINHAIIRKGFALIVAFTGSCFVMIMFLLVSLHSGSEIDLMKDVNIQTCDHWLLL